MTSKESDKEFWSRVSELPFAEQDRAQLVRQIDELRAEVERLRQQHENDMHTIDVGSRANAALEIRVEQLRAALEKITHLGHLSIGDARDIAGEALGEMRIRQE
jgi:hypothetical protein